MKTETRSKIIEIIRKKNGTRPIELVKQLEITPQAIHRHLKLLAVAGLIESHGRGPLTRYFIAGKPQLDRVRRWLASAAKPAENPEEFVCRTRDVFTARLPRLALFAQAGLNEDDAPLVIAAAGEVGNNCFDHNLGSWQDVPGCWFEAQATGGRLWLCIADRGQGIFNSLVRADPALADEQAALAAAFERTLSGRAPENRGNGLKFVRNVVNGGEGRGLACRSGAGLADYGRLGPECRAELAGFPEKPGGAVTLILWRLA
ncbi:MAG TPA: winged helix-turn-helix domain-containing protein [Elusimicrobiota bacterium]|nr:winged helix-turn-helix domain-containing protein [Elusimicrobiota bacterium]